MLKVITCDNELPCVSVGDKSNNDLSSTSLIVFKDSSLEIK